MVEVDHPDKLLKGLDRVRGWEVLDGVYLTGEGHHPFAADLVAKKVQG